MLKLLEVYPQKKIESASIVIPPSKPETQRAIVTGALAEGKSVIYNNLRCSETEASKKAMQSIGATITEYDDRLEIEGVANEPQHTDTEINCHGSGFAFRTMSVISSFIAGPVKLTGDKILQTRIMRPLFDAIESLGGKIEYTGAKGKAPIINHGGTLAGGTCTVPGNTCSQFTTAMLLGLPLSKNAIRLDVSGEIVSSSYVKQTLEALKMSGVALESTDVASSYLIKPSKFSSFNIKVSCDFTSASYILAIAALFPCRIQLEGMISQSHQGERAIVDMVKELGLDVYFDDVNHICHVANHQGMQEGDYEFDVKDCPNITPTLAAIGAYVNGSMRVVGASVTNYHKSPRLKAIIAELQKMGVDIEPIYQNAILDGFNVRGRGSYAGGVHLSSWKDHRIFLSLFIASLRTNAPNYLDGYQDVHCSFPDFFDQVKKLGVRFEETD